MSGKAVRQLAFYLGSLAGVVRSDAATARLLTELHHGLRCDGTNLASTLMIGVRSNRVLIDYG